MAVIPSNDTLGDLKKSLELHMGVMITSLDNNDMETFQRVHGVAGQLSSVLSWALNIYGNPEQSE